MSNSAPRSTHWHTNLVGAAAYLTIVPALLLLAIGRTRRVGFVRFHAMQCLVLAAFGIAGRITLHFSPVWPYRLSGLYSMALIGVWALAIVMAVQGTALWIPLISPIAKSLADG